MMELPDLEKFYRAVARYRRDVNKRWPGIGIPSQPSFHASEIGEDKIVLRNCNGHLATYRYRVFPCPTGWGGLGRDVPGWTMRFEEVAA